MSLLVVGSVALDTIETPFGKAERIVGGAATYIALAASYFTKNIAIVSIIGGDFPKEMLETFKKKNIDLSGLEILPQEKSFFWHGRYHLDMNTRDTLETQLNVLTKFQPKVPEQHRKAEHVMLGNLDPKIQMAVLEQMKQRPKWIVMDTMNYWIENTLEDLEKVIAQTDVLIINDEEARMLAQTYSLTKAARWILEKGPKYVVIKKGEHGALLFGKDKVFVAPALPLEEVFDPTGAGDTFAGGFIGYLDAVQNYDFEHLKNAVIYGTVMASYCVEAFGPEKLLQLNQNAIQERYQILSDLVRFDHVYPF